MFYFLEINANGSSISVSGVKLSTSKLEASVVEDVGDCLTCAM